MTERVSGAVSAHEGSRREWSGGKATGRAVEAGSDSVEWDWVGSGGLAICGGELHHGSEIQIVVLGEAAWGKTYSLTEAGRKWKAFVLQERAIASKKPGNRR